MRIDQIVRLEKGRDQVTRFLENRGIVETAPGVTFPVAILYRRYKSWCAEESLWPDIDRAGFHRHLDDLIASGQLPATVVRHSRRGACITGIRLIPPRPWRILERTAQQRADTHGEQ